MFNRRLAWIFGSVAHMSAGALGVACGTDNGNTPLPGDKDASAGNVDSGGGGDTDSGGGGDTDSGGNPADGGVDANCGKIPTLHEAGAGPYCPFQEGGTGDAATLFFGNCGATQTCCDYQGPSGGPVATCAANAAACPAPTAGYPLIDWGCDTKSQCTGAEVCCMFGKDGGTTNVVTDNACATGELLRALNVGGTKCAATCANGEIKLCANDSECTSPQKCVAFPTNAKQLGVCK
jgi:hypothetical protein